MVRNAEATRARILQAATAEFSANGLAGARVDRIAAAAGANKQLIYAHFGSKEGLFDAVMGHVVEGLLGDVVFDAGDLPGYAVALFDYGVEHPDLIRLARWHSLERPGVLAALPEAAESTSAKLQALADLQAQGLISSILAPKQLLEQVLALVHAGDDGVFAEFTAEPDDEAVHQVRREALRRSISLLVRPVADGGRAVHSA